MTKEIAQNPFALSRHYRRNYVNQKTRQLSDRLFHHPNGMRRRVYIKALDHPERNRNLLAEMVFTPFYTDIGLANPWHEVLAFGWLAENTRDIWYPGYAYVHNNEWGGFCRHLFIGFANEQDLENFQVFWELRDRSIYL